MTTLGNVPEIKEVKNIFCTLVKRGVVAQWELPYENLLTRLSAAIFFFTPVKDAFLSDIYEELQRFAFFTCDENTERSLSSLKYRVTFKDPQFL